MLDKEKVRLIWKCRRGMLELDLILQRFVRNKLHQLTKKQLKAFDDLLNCHDPELFAWFMGHEVPQDEESAEIVSLIKNDN
ncbi:hypothetical protein EP47_12575 [Legionella norrlandica]|uniref:FAD assembly factor SdhE n=1 Tax=Legionella norrlandica TaxID=1498499 RepID=A0A0A2SVW4_9GAMM|nr:succinate dehydrogenase assembly factor 2 [Legionella norrlandica]KGP63856.1 hypothetical protein EP47_12575 [Legionella norrlandica]